MYVHKKLKKITQHRTEHYTVDTIELKLYKKPIMEMELYQTQLCVDCDN